MQIFGGNYLLKITRSMGAFGAEFTLREWFLDSGTCSSNLLQAWQRWDREIGGSELEETRSPRFLLSIPLLLGSSSAFDPNELLQNSGSVIQILKIPPLVPCPFPSIRGHFEPPLVAKVEETPLHRHFP